jgi:hypothetical protein
MMKKTLIVLALGVLPLLGAAQAANLAVAPPGNTRVTVPTHGPAPQPLQDTFTVGRLEVTGDYVPPVMLANTIAVGMLVVTGDVTVAAPVLLTPVIAVGQLIVTGDQP